MAQGSDAPLAPPEMLCPLQPQLCPPVYSNSPSAKQLCPVKGLK